MEFHFDCSTIFQTDSDGFAVLDSYKDRPLGKMTQSLNNAFEVIDKMGEASAKAQKLTGTITTSSKFF